MSYSPSAKAFVFPIAFDTVANWFLSKFSLSIFFINSHSVLYSPSIFPKSITLNVASSKSNIPLLLSIKLSTTVFAISSVSSDVFFDILFKKLLYSHPVPGSVSSDAIKYFA